MGLFVVALFVVARVLLLFCCCFFLLHRQQAAAPLTSTSNTLVVVGSCWRPYGRRSRPYSRYCCSRQVEEKNEKILGKDGRAFRFSDGLRRQAATRRRIDKTSSTSIGRYCSTAFYCYVMRCQKGKTNYSRTVGSVRTVAQGAGARLRRLLDVRGTGRWTDSGVQPVCICVRVCTLLLL